MVSKEMARFRRKTARGDRRILVILLAGVAEESSATIGEHISRSISCLDTSLISGACR